MSRALFLALLFSACSPAEIGDPCTPEEVPPGGFVASESYLETATAQCRTRTCLVHGLAGDPRTAPADEVASHVYCSCRCAGPAGTDTCACPTGFSCTPIFENGGVGIVGSYCTRR